MPSRSIRREVERALLAIAVLLSVGLTCLVWYVAAYEVDELLDQGLREAGELLRSVLSATQTAELPLLAGQRDSGPEQHLVWQVLDAPDGTTVLARSHRAPVAPLGGERSPGLHDAPDGRWRTVVLPLTTAPPRLLIAAQSQDERAEARHEALAYTLGVSLGLGILATVLLGWRLRVALAPLGSLSQAVERYDPLRPHAVPLQTDREELQPLAQAINDLGRRLAVRVLGERAFTAHAAHALRTPLAGIQAQLSVALKEAPVALQPRLRRISGASTRLGVVVQALLALFRSGAGPVRRPKALRDLLSPLPPDDLVVVVEADQPLQVDPDLMTAVLVNLLDNARRHGARRVVATVMAEGPVRRLRLADDGEGCSGERRAQLQEALDGEELPEASRRTGLGLALASLVMRAHGGGVRLLSSETGFVIELHWPATEPEGGPG